MICTSVEVVGYKCIWMAVDEGSRSRIEFALQKVEELSENKGGFEEP